MAEFQEVHRQFDRMCWYYRRECKCPMACPINGMNISQCRKIAFERPKETEEIVMSWAAEHPEPVYPTWEEWLQSVGVMESSEPLLRRIKGQLLIDGIPAHAVPTSKVLQPMDADIAEKLGLQPQK